LRQSFSPIPRHERRKYGGYVVERHPNAKITASDALAMVSRHGEGESYRSIAADYGISRSSVGRVVAGKSRFLDRV
jgi:hypothetical protein